MPRRKQTYEAYGKSWGPVDLPNLEKAIKCFEKLNYLSQHFADSLSGQAAIWEQIEEKQKANEELQKTGIKLNEAQTREVLKEVKARQQNNDEIETGNQRLQRKSQITWGNVGDTFSNAMYSRYINNNPNATDAQLNKAASKFLLAGDVMQIAANTLHDGIKTLVGIFTQGIDAQRNVYNSTFSNVSVRSGTSRSQYYAQQRALPGVLNSTGLYNNVKVSDVMDMWNKLADIGMNQEQMFTTALDNVLTQKIVPYLDTTSKNFNILNTRLDNNFVKQIRGINQANLDIAGNNYNTQELLQTIIDQVQPMSDEALENLTKGSAEMTSLINYLTPTMGSDAATSLATQLYKQKNYANQIMSSGSTFEKAAYLNVYRSGLNVANPEDWNNIVALNAQTGMNLMNMSPDYSNTQSSLLASIFANAMGLSYEQASGFINLKNSGESYSSLVNKTDMTDNEWSNYYKNALQNFANDQNQTEKELTETTIENMSTEVAVISEQLGVFYDMARNALSTIIALIGTNLATSVGGKLLGGKGVSSSLTLAGAGLANGFAKGAPTAIGAGKIGAFTGNLGAVAGATGVAAGIGMAAYGGVNAYNSFKEGETGIGVGYTLGAAGGAAGAGALLALGASNPIGWVALAVGGAAILGTELYKLASETGDISKELESQTNEVMQNYQQAHNEEIKSLNETRDALIESNDKEEQKQLLIDAGIATQEELSKAQYDNKQALLDLTDQYIASKKALNSSAEELVRNLETKDNSEQNSISENMFALLDKDYNKMSTDDKAAAAEFGKEYIVWLKNQAASGDKDAQYRVNKIDASGVNLYDSEFSKEDLDAIMHYGSNKTSNALVKRFMTDSNNVHSLTVSKEIQTALGLENSFSDTDWTVAADYVSQAIDSGNKEDALELLAKAKAAGLTYDLLQQNSPSMASKLNALGINSYRQGLGYVPYDNYIANLHEGEAVLTASTAGELRNLVNTYRETSNQSINFEAIIQSQTQALVAKIDQVIEAISNNSEGSGSTYNNSIFNNMKYVRSLRSFN